jgi:TonB-dependent receptor
VLANVDASGNRISGGFIHPSYSDTFTRVFADPSSTSIITMTSNDKSGRTYLFSPVVRHRWPGLSIDYSLSYSNSATYYDISHNNDKYDSFPKGTITYRLANIGWSVDRSADAIWPTIAQLQGPDMNNMGNYGTLLLSQTDLRGFDTVINGKFDIKKDLALRLPTYIKTGFTYQRQSRKLWQDPRRYNFTGPDGVLGTPDDNVGLDQFADLPHTATEDEDKFFKNRGGVPPWADPYGVARHQKQYPEFWKEDIAFTSGQLTSRQFITENIAAAYIMGNVRLGKASMLTGVRVEDTRDTGEGPLSRITPEEAARRAAWVGVVSDVEQRRRNIAQFGGRMTNKGKYRFYLPGVHLKYEPIANLVTRLSWSTGVGRPPFGSIIPNTTVNDTAQTLTLSNPDLKPQYGKNWDLSAEYYFRPQGMISIGAFRKNITDYIATNNSQFVEEGQDNGFDGQYVGYRITTSINDGNAKIEGLEFSYQQQLVFLPGWTRGFGVYANFTKLRTEGNNSNFTTGPSSSAGGTIAGFLDKTGNIGLGYRGFGLDLRLQTVYRGKYLRANSPIAALVQWQEPKWTWNWKSRYNFSKGFGVFLDLENIFEVPLDRIYAAYPERVISYRTFHTKIVGGFTGRF